MKVNQITRTAHTVRFLKFKQIRYRLYYLIRDKVRKINKFQYPKCIHSDAKLLYFKEGIPAPDSVKGRSFTFLNKTYTFEHTIDWNYDGYGKLWNYNLTYFDFLLQKNMSKEEGLRLIYDFINYDEEIRGRVMPFPIALRGINWIKFLSYHEVRDEKINDALYAQYAILMDNIEYHILGNHLLENGFSLLFGAYYFQDEEMHQKALVILQKELEEQILADGAHFELTPMYHQIMLLRVLDCINLVENNNWKQQAFLSVLKEKAEEMLGWLKEMTFQNGEIPLFNDSTNKVAPSTHQLKEYTKRLGIGSRKVSLGASGYRKRTSKYYECIVDIGNIGPDYIPGHAHSDTFNFELYIHHEPVIVDTGLSTYDAGARRMLERSTASHNTVEIDNIDQSEVWGGFRVARRAKIVDLWENEEGIAAIHDGYKQTIGCMHKREWKFHNKKIIIRDTVSGKHKKAIAYLHFHPDVKFEIVNESLISNSFRIVFFDTCALRLQEYNYSSEFNYHQKALVVAAEFNNQMSMEINVE